MFRLTKLLLILVLAAAAMTAVAGNYYDPDQPGHGVTVQNVGERYVAQWYFHDGDQARWIASDVCQWGGAVVDEDSDRCPVWTVDAFGFPAAGAELVEAGFIVLERIDGGVLITYDFFIEQIDCGGVMVGPLPQECRDEDGNRLWDVVIQRGLDESGSLELELLVD